MESVIEYLNRAPLVAWMLVISIGYTVGRLSWRRVGLGPAAATMFVAIWLGYLGVGSATAQRDASLLGNFGLALFIYSVGFEAGPRFFTSFRDRSGWRFVLVGSSVCAIAVATALIVGWAFGFDGATVAGILAGSLTSASTLGAASEITAERADLSISFALTYPVGLLGLVLMVQTLPGLFSDDLEQDADAAEQRLSRHRRQWHVDHESDSPEVTRTFEVADAEVAEQTLRELDLARRTGCVVSRIHRNDEMVVATADAKLEIGDFLVVTGRVDELREFQKVVGPEVNRSFHNNMPRPRRVRVRARAAGKSLAELKISARRCVVTRIERGNVLIEPGADVVLRRNDIVEVVGRRRDLRAVADMLGHMESSNRETDIAVYSGGILLGLLLGRVELSLGDVDLRLGMAGGLLIVGLVLSRLGHIGRLRTQVPQEAQQLVRDLGILLFVTDIGLHSGASLVGGIAHAPWKVLIAGAIVMKLSVLGALFIGRRTLKLRPIDAWGSVCGGMTSTAALHAVRRVTDSSEAAISYAAAYAVATVLATLAGQLVVHVMG